MVHDYFRATRDKVCRQWRRVNSVRREGLTSVTPECRQGIDCLPRLNRREPTASCGLSRPRARLYTSHHQGGTTYTSRRQRFAWDPVTLGYRATYLHIYYTYIHTFAVMPESVDWLLSAKLCLARVNFAVRSFAPLLLRPNPSPLPVDSFGVSLASSPTGTNLTRAPS